MKVNKLYLGLALFIAGCAKPVAQPVTTPLEPEKPKVTITILSGSDPVPEWVIKRAIKVTNKKCQTRGLEGVEEVIFFHKEAKRHTNVIYRCIENGEDE